MHRTEPTSTILRVFVLSAIVIALPLLFACSAVPALHSPATRAAAQGARPDRAEPTTTVVATVTVANGSLLARDIIPQLETAFSLSEDEVKNALAPAESPLIGERTTGSRRMEGMIAPGVYEIAEGETLEDWVAKWTRQSEQRYDTVVSRVEDANDLSASERLVLASIVEAECLRGEHRDVTAATFLNRLEQGQRLQSCVTAEYALGLQRPFLLNKDVAIKSAYNTYYASGLPEGPISSVSDESLAAASALSSDPDVYYFFYDYVSGEMHFFSDYKKFRAAAAASRERFESESPVGAHDEIDKQALFGAEQNAK